MYVYFISGASGVGKTTVMESLRNELSEPYVVKDFDERGVPDKAGREWRLKETEYWIREGKNYQLQGKTLVVSGLANPEEMDRMKKPEDLKVQIILLDADEKCVEERLRSRNSEAVVRDKLERAVGSVESFISNNTQFVKKLRSICAEANIPIIDTTNLTPHEVSEKIKELL